MPPAHAVDARRALRYLGDVHDKRHQVRADQGFDMAGTVTAVLANQDRLCQAYDKRDDLVQHIEALLPWGDFRLPDRQTLAGRLLWFYIVPERQTHLLYQLPLPWQVVHKDNRRSWVVVIDSNEPPGDALPVPRAHTGALCLGELYKRLDEIEVELEDAVAERQSLTRWIYLMSHHLARAEDQAALNHAAAQTLVDEELFLVQGWVPEPAVVPGYINHITLCEIVWVLQRCYCVTKQQLRDIIEGLLTTKQLIVENVEVAWKALRAYDANSADFYDALIGQANIHSGCEYTVTFDKKAASLPGFDLLG